MPKMKAPTIVVYVRDGVVSAVIADNAMVEHVLLADFDNRDELNCGTPRWMPVSVQPQTVSDWLAASEL